MAIKSRYDVAADRMRLELQAAEGASQAYWFSRRQWLALLWRLRAVVQELGLLPTAPVPAKGLRPRPPQPIEAGAAEPVMVDGIRLKVEGEGAQLILVIGKQGRGIKLPAAGVKKFEEMVLMQAERAGWDPQAALQRLKATMVARSAMNRASRNSRPE